MNIMIDPGRAGIEPRLCDDLTVCVAGQGGDGSLTIITLLADVLAHHGLNLYRTNNIASRIKGGHAAALVRGSHEQLGGLGSAINVLVGFDDEAIRMRGRYLTDDAVVIYDTSRGPMPEGIVPKTATVLQVPFSRYSVRELRRDLFKNSFGFGLLSRVIGLGDKEADNYLCNRFKKLSAGALKGNRQALQLGFGVADELGLTPGRHILKLPDGEKKERLFITGNEATAFGFLAAGGRFYAGYPITPATEVMEWLGRNLPQFGGVMVQAEDELSAINMAIGAALTGARAMTGSSSPGIALMGESISHCGSAEIPMVIIDSQRAGPSTGMPTKVEQSDLGMLINGGNGDFPRIVLCPGTASDCFEIGALATNLSQIAQCPVIIALDRSLSQDGMTVPPFDLDSVKMDTGKLLDAAALGALDEYKRYAITDDGISPWVVPGTPQGMNLVTGNERNEWGQVSTEQSNRVAMMDKRSRKIQSITPLLPRAVSHGDPAAKIGAICVGVLTGVMDEARGMLELDGLKVKLHCPRTLHPLLDETLDFIAGCERVYVVEHSESGQLERVLKGAGADAGKLHGVRKYDGTPFWPDELAGKIRNAEASK
ncbi:MAG: 2-oxoacid:acceptor oxidoreductase subunit alpha [Alphaproteobacteria bacterium]|nr:2-oxoacid:acceptor oxidoreductase subunit alpha [Alphaproteobacteria bacterium]